MTHRICTKSFYFIGGFIDSEHSGVRAKASIPVLCNASICADHSSSSSRGTPGHPQGWSPSPWLARPSPASVPFPMGLLKGLPKELQKNN